MPKELWCSAGENGLLGVMMPEEYGGSAADALYAAITWEEQVRTSLAPRQRRRRRTPAPCRHPLPQSYTGCTGPGFALHSEIVMPYILHYGTEEQKAHYLPKLCSGEMISAIAMTEPGEWGSGVRLASRKGGTRGGCPAQVRGLTCRASAPTRCGMGTTGS